MKVDWRTWAADHPIKAERRVADLDEELERRPDMPEDQAADLRATRGELVAGIADHRAAAAASRHFADATRVDGFV